MMEILPSPAEHIPAGLLPAAATRLVNTVQPQRVTVTVTLWRSGATVFGI